jgi:DNA primase large subunit
MSQNNTFDDTANRTTATIERNRDRAWAKIAQLLINYKVEISDDRVGLIIQDAIINSVSDAFNEANTLSQRLATETEKLDTLWTFAKSKEMEEFFNQDAELQ